MHSVGGTVGSQLPPVSTQLWNPYLMMSDPYLTTGLTDQSAVAASLAALQAATFYQSLVAPASLLGTGVCVPHVMFCVKPAG